MCTAVLSERIARLCNFTTGCRESLDVPLKPCFAYFCLCKGDKDGALSPGVWLTALPESLCSIFACGEGNELFITELIPNLLVFWVEGVYATHCSDSQ